MMKKSMAAVVLGLSLAFGGVGGMIPFVPVPVVSANPYPAYLWGDSNYQRVYGHMGVGYYVDWSSEVLVSDRGKGPGNTQFSINVVSVNMNTNEVVGTKTYAYIENDSGAYVSIDGGGYNRFDPDSDMGAMQVVVQTYKLCMNDLYS
ncbi:hypothetical protein [uncultured Dialister sp.]|jgi:hypothetical protein|uniref:hypothetical protein n=1 Tax=uncultured Dialister sp. TaxID=278064 RepID=UPI0025E7FCDB|nr:hypothetical protein [uncultured Dialister sp.]